jgi:hypothetical protein
VVTGREESTLESRRGIGQLENHQALICANTPDIPG